MAEPEYKIGDIVTAVTFCGEQIFFAVAKILAERDPELGSWLLCNWGSKLSGHI